jgi:quinol-cytochrome oxidoreductase complex cytochrome b subunit
VQRTHRVLLAILAVLLLVLVATGIWLSFRYQPSGSFVGARPQSGLRVAHRVTSTLFLVTALAFFGLSIAVSVEGALRRGTPTWLVGLVTITAALAAVFTGRLLPWDVLALAPVRRGEFRGFGFLFGHSRVHSVLVGASAVTTASLRSSFLVHAVVIPVVFMALGAAGWRLTRRSRLASPTEVPEP